MLQPYIGSKNEDLYLQSFGQTVDTKVSNVVGLKFALGNEHITFNAGIIALDITLNLPPGFPLPISFAERMGLEISTFGINIDWNNFLVMSEYLDVKFDHPDAGDSALSDSDAWYAMIGYRFGKFLPHVTFAELNADNELKLDPTTGMQMINFADLGGVSSQTLTIGLRYELNPSAALKFEWSNVDPQGNTSGLFGPSGSMGPVPLYDDDDSDVFSIAIDVIF